MNRLYMIIHCAVLMLLLSTSPTAQADDKVELPVEIGSSVIPTGETVIYTYRPDGIGPHPTILFLQGYPCRVASHEDDKNRARQKLVKQLVAKGYLVHIAEKPGLGGGVSNVDCRDLLYSQEVAAFQSVLDNLIESPDVDRENLYLFGHSMGGQTAPLIAQGRPVRGIITYGIHAKPWFEFMIDVSRAQSERLGMDPAIAEQETRQMIPFLYDLMVEKLSWTQLKTKHADTIAIGILRADGAYLNGRHYSFWADLNDASVLEA